MTQNNLKATTEKHKIELLNVLMVRLIKEYSDLEDCKTLISAVKQDLIEIIEFRKPKQAKFVTFAGVFGQF